MKITSVGPGPFGPGSLPVPEPSFGVCEAADRRGGLPYTLAVHRGDGKNPHAQDNAFGSS